MARDLARLETSFRQAIGHDHPLAGERVAGLFAAGGKRLRPALVLLCGHLGSYDFGRLRPAAMAVEFTHTATLVHDDVIDRSPLRRGLPALAAEHGEGTAIVVGDYYFAKAYEEASRTGSARVVDLLARAMQSVCVGELMQQAQSFQFHPSEEAYLLRIRHKTADLLAISCSIGAELGDLGRSDARRVAGFGGRLGIAFQIVDDVLDYVGTEALMGKPSGQDLLEGNATLPLLLAMEEESVSRRLSGLLQDGRQLAPEQVREVVETVVASGACEAALRRAAGVADEATRLLGPLARTPAGASLEGLADYVVSRKL